MLIGRSWPTYVRANQRKVSLNFFVLCDRVRWLTAFWWLAHLCFTKLLFCSNLSVVRTFGATGCLNQRSAGLSGWLMLCTELAALRVCSYVRYWDAALVFSTSDIRAQSGLAGMGPTADWQLLADRPNEPDLERHECVNKKAPFVGENHCCMQPRSKTIVTTSASTATPGQRLTPSPVQSERLIVGKSFRARTIASASEVAVPIESQAAA